MSTILMREPHAPWREADFAARWAAGAWVGQTLRTEQAARYTILYQGRPGGGAGPDFRDAVLLREDGTRVVGDVELHLRPRSWTAHGHHRDARYNHVVLHVVFAADAGTPALVTPLASGDTAPIAILADAMRVTVAANAAGLPCAHLYHRVGAAHLRALLCALGSRRFDAKVRRFHTDLTTATSSYDAGALWSPEDRLLWVALAEALGYGRDRETLRRLGQRLIASADARIPESDMTSLPRVELDRLRALLELRARWHAISPWPALKRHLAHGTPRTAATALLGELRVPGGALSPGRASIVTANVVLPFAAAIAENRRQPELVARAKEVYAALPGLPSNAITRLMSRQLGLPRLPSGAQAQQGLQQIWSEWCREKRCQCCPCAGPLPPSSSPRTCAPSVQT